MEPWDAPSFGTLSLPGWQEVQPAPEVSMAPATPTWAVLAALVVALALLGGWRAVQGWRADRYRREALRLLAGAPIEQVPALLKRTALCAFERREVAPLSGPPWAAFLDRTCPSAGFGGLSSVLVELTYRGHITEGDAERLRRAAATWIRRHRSTP